MYLNAIINEMYVKGTATEDMNIHVKDLSGNTFYNGNLRYFHDYINTHNTLDQNDGFPRNVMHVNMWNVVEILVDCTRKEENDLPYYNKGKIIIVM